MRDRMDVKMSLKEFKELVAAIMSIPWSERILAL